jgi:glucuronate isomerase
VSVRELPLICPHGHVEPQVLAEDEAFPEPTALLIVPDHYIFRMLYSVGIPLERLGIPAPLAGHYPAVKLGPPWWFHDSVEGMKRFREQTTETAGIYNTAGFNDDTRACCSIPARHDLARRVDANWLGGLVARHVIDLADAFEMARALAYDLAKQTYKLDGADSALEASVLPAGDEHPPVTLGVS